MKKINYLYFICTTLMWLCIDKLLSILTHYHPAWLLLLPAYCCWYILSAPFFYIIKKRKGVKKEFVTYYYMESQWATFWIDLSNRELAYLCMLNPFKIHYLPLDYINNAKIDVRYSKDKKYIDHVNCIFFINYRRTKIRVATRGRYNLIKAEGEGTEIINRVQKFINLLNRNCETYL